MLIRVVTRDAFDGGISEGGVLSAAVFERRGGTALPSLTGQMGERAPMWALGSTLGAACPEPRL